MMEYINELGRRIGLSAGQLSAVRRGYERDPERAEAIARELRKRGRGRPLRKAIKKSAKIGGELTLACALLMAEEAQREYQRLGIPPEIFDATMSDIRIWADHYKRDNGFDGLGEIGWIVHHCRLELFRLGRLQFERSRVRLGPCVPLRCRRSLPVRSGQHCLAVHIPEGEKLSPSRCRESFEASALFFRRFFPGEPVSCYSCCSWLLYSQNREFLPSGSNIVSFMDCWNVVFDIPDGKQAIERIWGRKERDPADYPVHTALQAGARKWLMDGHSLGMGLGFRWTEEE